MKVSVIILNWNGRDVLRSFLPSVTRYSCGERIEVCVADNGSTDDSLQILANEFPSVRVIALDKNYGFAQGYNKAIRYVDSEYVVLLNSDVEVTAGWLEPMMDFLDHHSAVAACQPKIRDYNNRGFFEYAGAAGGYIDRYGYPFCRGRLLSYLETDKGQYNTVQPVFWATGAALMIRLRDYVQVGGLDARFFAHMEEIDLCWRLGARGRGVVCVPQSVVYHFGAATLKKDNPRKTFLNFRNSLLMLYKNLPEKELNHVLLVRLLLDLCAVSVFFFSGRVLLAKAVLAAMLSFRKMHGSFSEDRKANMKLSTVDYIPGRMRFSLFWRYYIKGQKTFSALFARNGS